MKPTEFADNEEARIAVLKCGDSAITRWVLVDCNGLSGTADAFVVPSYLDGLSRELGISEYIHPMYLMQTVTMQREV